MSQTNNCKCREKHEGHLCVLISKNMTEAVECLTDKPTVVCFSCGREANSADNVCMPMPLAEHPVQG